jgi:hypothetical protein
MSFHMADWTQTHSMCLGPIPRSTPGAQVVTFSLPDGNPENQDLAPAWLQESFGVDEKTAKEIDEAAIGWGHRVCAKDTVRNS